MSNVNLVLEVNRRDDVGKNACRRLRATGLVPGIVYGMGLDPFSIAVSAKRMGEILHGDAGRNAILELTMVGEGAGQKRAAMIKDLTRDPVSGNMLHVDFVRVDLQKKVQVAVPIHVTGEAAGVKTGGVLELVHREIHVECLPGDIPEHLDIDVSALDVGDQVHVREVAVPASVTVMDDPEQVLVHVVPPHVVKEEGPTEEEAVAEGAAAAEGESEESTEKEEGES